MKDFISSKYAAYEIVRFADTVVLDDCECTPVVYKFGLVYSILIIHKDSDGRYTAFDTDVQHIGNDYDLAQVKIKLHKTKDRSIIAVCVNNTTARNDGVTGDIIIIDTYVGHVVSCTKLFGGYCEYKSLLGATVSFMLLPNKTTLRITARNSCVYNVSTYGSAVEFTIG